MEYQDFPHMLYKGGKALDDYRIADDADAEAELAKEGYVRYGDEPKARRTRKADAAE